VIASVYFIVDNNFKVEGVRKGRHLFDENVETTTCLVTVRHTV